MVHLIRFIHGAITVFFLSCLAYIYYAGITNQVGLLVYIAAALLVLEGVVVVLNRGDCPLGAIHNRLGDHKTFFELFLPRPLAKRAVPFLGVIAAIGILLVLL
mgnify:CR=1 FL=1